MFDNEYCSECKCKNCEETRKNLKKKYKHVKMSYARSYIIEKKDTSVKMPKFGDETI